MGRTGSIKHTHKYFRGHDGLWHCAGIDGCTHYMPANIPETIMIGRKSLCWGCEVEFKLTYTSLKVESGRPMCFQCTQELKEEEAAAEVERARTIVKRAAQVEEVDEIEVYDSEQAKIDEWNSLTDVGYYTRIEIGLEPPKGARQRK